MSGFNTLDKGSAGAGAASLTEGSTLNPFGSLNVAQQTPTGQATFVYGINTTQWVTASNGVGASVSAADGIVTCTSGNSLSGSASVRLRRGLKYRAGQGGICKLTAIFNSGTVGATSLVGIGNPECGYYFARSGTSFGISHLSSGKREIRKLTVTAGAGTGESVTITLSGASKTFTITGGSNVNQTSYLIAEQDYSQVGSGWDAESIDGTVYFLSKRAQSVFTGSYDITAATASGSFSTVQSGVNITSTFVSQSSWNIDKMDGSGVSRVTLDPAKGNIYSIGYQYLGFGNAIFSIEDQKKGLFVPVHQIENANTRDSVVLRNPYGFARWSVANTATTVGSTIKGASGATFLEGAVNRNIGPAFATGSLKSGVSTTIIPFLTIRANQVYNNMLCYGEIDPYNISIGTDFNAAANTDILNVYVYRNATLTGPVNFQHINLNNSICAGDASATGISVGPNTQLLKTFSVPANNALTLALTEGEFFASHKDRLTIAGAVTGNTAKVSTNISWYEDQ